MQADQINLAIVAQSDNFNNWMYGEIKPYVKGDILEVGSGLGTFSQKIIADFPQSEIYLSDINEEYLLKLREKFGVKNNVKVIKLDLNNKSDFTAIGENKFNAIICLNVLEHVVDDSLALQEMKKLLKPDGFLILLVPSHPWLYNKLDRAVGHYRRYNQQELKQKLTQVGFKLERIFHFNFFAIFGWFGEGSVLQQSIHNHNLFWLFDKLVPIFKWLEKHFLFKRLGISLIVIAKK